MDQSLWLIWAAKAIVLFTSRYFVSRASIMAEDVSFCQYAEARISG